MTDTITPMALADQAVVWCGDIIEKAYHYGGWNIKDVRAEIDTNPVENTRRIVWYINDNRVPEPDVSPKVISILLEYLKEHELAKRPVKGSA